MPQIRVRRATVGNASGIAHVHVQAWREAYAHQLPAEVLNGLQAEPRAARWATIIHDDVTDMYVAKAFYRKNHFETDGTERDGHMSGHAVHIIRMVRS